MASDRTPVVAILPDFLSKDIPWFSHIDYFGLHKMDFDTNNVIPKEQRRKVFDFFGLELSDKKEKICEELDRNIFVPILGKHNRPEVNWVCNVVVDLRLPAKEIPSEISLPKKFKTQALIDYLDNSFDKKLLSGYSKTELVFIHDVVAFVADEIILNIMTSNSIAVPTKDIFLKSFAKKIKERLVSLSQLQENGPPTWDIVLKNDISKYDLLFKLNTKKHEEEIIEEVVHEAIVSLAKGALSWFSTTIQKKKE